MRKGREEQKRKADSLGRLILGKKGYHCGRLLGKGAFSRVYYVEGKDDLVCACKVSENVKLLEREARVMAVLEHPLFPKYFGFWREAGLYHGRNAGAEGTFYNGTDNPYGPGIGGRTAVSA